VYVLDAPEIVEFVAVVVDDCAKEACPMSNPPITMSVMIDTIRIFLLFGSKAPPDICEFIDIGCFTSLPEVKRRPDYYQVSKMIPKSPQNCAKMIPEKVEKSYALSYHFFWKKYGIHIGKMLQRLGNHLGNRLYSHGFLWKRVRRK
jgi:hypothetical protein